MLASGPSAAQRATSSLMRDSTSGYFLRMFWVEKDTATARRIAFHVSVAAPVSRLGAPCGSHM